MKKEFLLLLGCLICYSAFAKHHTTDLEISYQPVNYTGQLARGIMVNQQIPGPTLHFKEGDTVTINVHNKLDTEAAIHWHGLLLPWQMDGVLAISQRGIPPGGHFKYHFKLRQSGTYWYHSHAGLQEQEGLYGAIVIDPKTPPAYHYDKDFVIVLSDWSNTRGSHIFRNLKKSGDYYSPHFPIQPSLLHFLKDYSKANASERNQLWMDYQMMQKMRMGAYDISDIAYDAFLLNGHDKREPWTAKVKVGDVVRLRFIAAGASTFFQVKVDQRTMKMVHIQGNDVQPYPVESFRFGPGETNDVLIKIKDKGPFIIYAESADQVGAAYGALITDEHQAVNYKAVKPFPVPIPATREKMMNEKKRGISSMMPGLSPSKEKSPKTVGNKYQHLKARVMTNRPQKPIEETINLELSGYMDQYIWFINGTPQYASKPIQLKPGKRYRVVFNNKTMMHHPMHIHGHWFILRNGHGSYDPLLHTLDVAPGSQVVADLDTDASGQWFFHCHMLYHMVAGMARVFQYASLIEIAKGEEQPKHEIGSTGYHNRPIVRVDKLRPIPFSLVNNPVPHPNAPYFATSLQLDTDPFHNVQSLTFHGLYGPDYNKLQLFINDAEVGEGSIDNADIDVFYWHLISRLWAVKGGVNYYYRPAKTPYWQPGIGLEGVMPYYITDDNRLYYHKGSFKLDVELGRNTQITNNLFFGISYRVIAATKTVVMDEIGRGLNETQFTLTPSYRLAPGLSVYAEYEHDQYYSRLKSIRRQLGKSLKEDTMSFGLAVLF